MKAKNISVYTNRVIPWNGIIFPSLPFNQLLMNNWADTNESILLAFQESSDE